jgi:hypothetical protein
MILQDELLMMGVIQGMLDRRIISYRTGHELLGYDFETLLGEMKFEKDLVIDGTLGILGSPYNSKASTPGQPQVQDKQRTPVGTPSEGRPKNKPAKTPAPAAKPPKNKAESPTSAEASLVELLQEMSVDELDKLLHMTRAIAIEKLVEEDED